MLSIMGVVRPVREVLPTGDRSLVGQSPESILRRGIAPVMEGRRIFPSLTVEENLRLGAASIKDRRAIAEDLDRWCSFFPILGERKQQPAGEAIGRATADAGGRAGADVAAKAVTDGRTFARTCAEAGG